MLALSFTQVALSSGTSLTYWNLLTTAQPRTGLIRLNIEARSDILWWYHFITHWSGPFIMLNPRCSNPDVVLTSNASSSWGCGAFYGNAWFQLQSPAATEDSHITTKELLPIIISAAIWGAQWANQCVLCRCDNEAVVCIVNTGTSKDLTVMCLMHCYTLLWQNLTWSY